MIHQRAKPAASFFKYLEKNGARAKPVARTSYYSISRTLRQNPRSFGGFVFVGFFLYVALVGSLGRMGVRDQYFDADHEQAQAVAFLRSPTPDKKVDPGQAPQVCSHQLLNAPAGALDGSLAALEAFWSAGVRCFDIDVVTLKDGTLLASHPQRLIKAVEGIRPQDHTLESIRKAGVDGTAYPVFDEILQAYAKLLSRVRQPPFYNDKSELVGPLLNVDLKGPSLSESLLAHMADLVLDLHLQDNIALCVSSLLAGETGPGIDILSVVSTNPRYKDIPMGLVLRDRIHEDLDIGRIQGIVEAHRAGFRLLVPSFKFTAQWFEEINTKIGLPITAWTIDTPDDFAYASKMQVAAVIANDPMNFIPSSVTSTF